MPPMGSMIVSIRRRLPRRIRTGALRLLGRDRVVRLTLPLPPASASPASGAAPTRPRTLTIRTPRRTYVNRLLADSGLAGYDPDTLACFLAAIDGRGTAPVFDVGANIGIFSWLAAALTPATVVAFEPTPDLNAQMRAICTANGLAVTVEEVALGAVPGIALLYLSEKTDSSNSLRAGFRRSHQTVSVTVETIDGYVSRTGTVPAVLKVDTESTEPDVLRGAATVLATSRPWIICEVLAGRTEVDLTAILAPLGYSWYRIDGAGPLERRTVIEGDPSYAHMNWLFAPEEPEPAFWQAFAGWRAAIAGLESPAVAPSPTAAPDHRIAD
jgi:FkbM family methyltransferase